MGEVPFKTARDAFVAIHEGLSHDVWGNLGDCEYDAALKSAMKMKEVEKHIFGVFDTGDLSETVKQSDLFKMPLAQF